VKKLGLELGGNAPFVVFDDADIDAAVEGAIVSKYRNMGQTCVCANRIYAQDKIYDQFVEKLSNKVAAMKIGDGTEQRRDPGSADQYGGGRKVEKHIADAVKHGARIVTRGKRHRSAAPSSSRRYWPMLRPDALVSHEETFGPLAPVFRFKDEADVIAMCNNSPFGLASYFYSRDLGRVWAGRRSTGVRHGRRQHRVDNDRGGAVRRRQGKRPGARGLAPRQWKNMSRSNM